MTAISSWDLWALKFDYCNVDEMEVEALECMVIMHERWQRSRVFHNMLINCGF